MKLTFPFPPSNNHYKRHYCTVDPHHAVRAHSTRETEQFAMLAQNAVNLAGNPSFDGDVVIKLTVYRPNRRFDLDNSLKVVLDQLQRTGVIRNDNRVVRIEAEAVVDSQNPRVEIAVSLQE